MDACVWEKKANKTGLFIETVQFQGVGKHMSQCFLTSGSPA